MRKHIRRFAEFSEGKELNKGELDIMSESESERACSLLANGEIIE